MPKKFLKPQNVQSKTMGFLKIILLNLLDFIFIQKKFRIAAKLTDYIQIRLQDTDEYIKRSLIKLFSKSDFESFLLPHLNVLSKSALVQNYSIYGRRVDLNNYVSNLYQNEIQFGAFSGVKLNPYNKWGGTDRASMILGIYEFEVQSLIKSVIENEIERKTFLDIGAGDGFYAVGFARTVKDSKVYAWELDDEQRNNIQNMCLINKINIQLFAKATQDFYLELPNSIKNDKVIILCDIEGMEYHIINKTSLSYFEDALWIIELHEFNDEHVLLQDKLITLAAEQGFKQDVLHTGSRDLSKFTYQLNLDDVDRWLLCPEGRGPKSGKWLVLRR